MVDCISEHLRKSIVPSLEAFIHGLLSHEDNQRYFREVEPSELARTLYHESLIYLFRILIVLHAESRGLLPIDNSAYRELSLTSLRAELAESSDNSRRKGSTYLWDRLWKLFDLLECGKNDEKLTFKPLGGQLFSRDALSTFRQLRLSDAAMTRFLEVLLFTTDDTETLDSSRRAIPYDDLDVMQLGTIHETLLYLEPHVASEELVVIRVSSSKLKYVPRRHVSDFETRGNEIVRIIHEGQFYFRNWNGTRKGFGTYYTPRELTIFLVESTLTPLIEGKTPSQILALRILDPAVGSGAFLVAAALFLTKHYLLAKESVNDDEMMVGDAREKELYVRRMIVKHCIYGVDVNPLAVELAKVSLWILTMGKNKSLDFLDDNIRVGNSLLGFVSHLGMDFQILLKYLEKHRHDNVDPTRLRELDPSSLKNVLDLVTLSHLYPNEKLKNINANKSSSLRSSSHSQEFLPRESLASLHFSGGDLVRRWKIFHWELEFPEIFRRGGFDAIITNPPWNILKPNSNEFFSKFIPEFRTYTKKERLVIMNELLEKDELVRHQWQLYLTELRMLSRYFKESGFYQKQYRGDLNLYKLFLERSFNLLKREGYLGMVIPSAIYTDLGARELRKMLFQESRLQFLFSFENREGIFGIHKSYKVVLLVTKKELPSKDHVFKVAFCIGSRPRSLKKTKLSPEVIASGGYAPKKEELLELLAYLMKYGMTMTFSLVQKLNPTTLALVEIKNDLDLEIAKKLYSSHPRFEATSHESSSWYVNLNREFDMTNDLKHFMSLDATRSFLLNKKELPLEKVSREILSRGSALVWNETMDTPSVFPLYEGKMIWQFNPFFAPARYWVRFPPPKPLKSVGTRNILPYRTAFRAISGSTNERTLVACVLPPAYHGNTLQSLMITINRKNEQFNEEMIQLYSCGLLNSLVLDWLIRLKVSSGLNYHFVHSLPFPRLTSRDWIFRQLIPRIARLSCLTADFAILWEKTFRDDWMPEIVETSALKDWELLSSKWDPRKMARDFVMFKKEMRDGKTRAILRAEIDALIARLFKLDEDELVHVLNSFPVLERKEKLFLSEFRTKRLLLEIYEDFFSFS